MVKEDPHHGAAPIPPCEVLSAEGGQPGATAVLPAEEGKPGATAVLPAKEGPRGVAAAAAIAAEEEGKVGVAEWCR